MPYSHASPSDRAANPISALFPAFDFEGFIDHGPAGTVYKARQRSLDREVAIRVASRESASDPAFRTSFSIMARSMASLGHPGLIRVYDSGEVDGLPYVVMEFVPGKSLRHSSQGKAVEPRQAAQIIATACQALAHAHGNGMVHGAICPANILLTQKCEPKIGNFGCRHRKPPEAAGSNRSAYQAPETGRSGGSGSESPRADVYSLGVVLRELLTGVPADAAETRPVTIPDSRLAEICRKAAHPDPAQRYSDAGTLAEALAAYLTSRVPAAVTLRRPVASHRPKPVVTPKVPAVSYPSSRGGRVLLVHGMIIATLLLAIHGVWGAYQEKQESLARLRKLEEAKPGVIVLHSEPGKESPHGIDPSLVQLKP